MQCGKPFHARAKLHRMKMTLLALLMLAVAFSASPQTAPAATEEEEAVRKAVQALSRLKVSGYIQAQYVHSDRSADTATGTAGTRNLDQFSVRRGYVKFAYQASKTSRLVIQPDFTTSGVALKDGYVELVEPWTSWKNTLTAGQFNWPFGFEIGYSSSARELPELSLVIRTLFPGERDRGAMISGAGADNRFRYRAAVVNGTGTTQPFDFNQRKDVVGSIGGSLGPLDAGLSMYRGAELVSLGGLTAGREFDKQREGIDFQWRTPLPGLRLRGEYIRGVQPPSPGTAVAFARAARVDGWYLYAVQNLGERHQVAVRADEYDPDTASAGNATRTIGASYIFHWDRNSKVMFAYEQPSLEIADPDDDLLTIRYQYSF